MFLLLLFSAVVPLSRKTDVQLSNQFTDTLSFHVLAVELNVILVSH